MVNSCTLCCGKMISLRKECYPLHIVSMCPLDCVIWNVKQFSIQKWRGSLMWGRVFVLGSDRWTFASLDVARMMMMVVVVVMVVMVKAYSTVSLHCPPLTSLLLCWFGNYQFQSGKKKNRFRFDWKPNNGKDSKKVASQSHLACALCYYSFTAHCHVMQHQNQCL